MIALISASARLRSVGEEHAIALTLGREAMLPGSYPTMEAARKRLDYWLHELAAEFQLSRLMTPREGIA